MNQDALRVLVEAVLHEAVEHTAGIDGKDEIRIRLDDLALLLLAVVWDRVAGIADIVAAVDPLSIAVPGDLLDRQVPDDAGPALLRTELEVLPQELRDDLEVLREEVRFLLRVELRDVPAFGDVVHLPQRRGLAVADHVPDELEDVHRPQEHEGAFELLRAAHAHQVAVLPDRVLRVEADVRLRAERDLHLRDLAVVEDLGGLRFDGLRGDAARQEQVKVQLLAGGGEVVDVERDGVPLLLLVVRDVLVDPDDSHDLRDRRVEDRDLLVHDLRRLVGDPRQDELDDLELLFRLRAVGLLREMRLEAAPGLFQREVH